MEYQDFDVYWDGHASVRIEDEGFTVAVDPYTKAFTDYEADIVLVTHQDAGHYDPEAIEEVKGPRTVLVAPKSMEDKDFPIRDVEFISEGEHLDIYSVEIEAVPMFNEHHERGNGVGYRFVMRDKAFYVAGDIGLQDELRELENRVNVAFLPVEGVYTMEVEEAIKAAVRIKPDIAVPYHYGKPFFEDVEVDLRGFEAELVERNIGVEVLDSEI
jgi:L-ascorbate metabolism protein UlaG (beta-lactamase superfamily)